MLSLDIAFCGKRNNHEKVIQQTRGKFRDREEIRELERERDRQRERDDNRTHHSEIFSEESFSLSKSVEKGRCRKNPHSRVQP